MVLMPKKFADFLSGDKAKKAIIIAGIVLILLLFLSTLPFGRSETEASSSVAISENAAEIERALEQRLEALISQIEGAGSVTVMVTLDSTSEHIFAEETRTQNSASSGTDSLSQSSDTETSVVLAGSSKEPLETSIIQPKVRGVAVVCSGAADPVVKEKIANVVSGVLNIGISRVCVTC